MGQRWEPMLQELARTRYGGLCAYAFSLTGAVDSAQDLVQEALISVFSAKRTFPTAGQAESYVRRAIASRFIDEHRRTTRRSRADLAAAMRGTPIAAPPAEPFCTELERALLTLPLRERACVVLRFMDDLSISETAAALGLSEGAVKRYVSDGIRALNAQLGTVHVGAEVDTELVTVSAIRGKGRP